MSEKLKLLKKALGRCWTNEEEHQFHCPKCNHHKLKLSVNIDKGVFKCWICEYHGRSLRRLVRSYGDFNSKQEWDALSGSVNLKDFRLDLFENNEEKYVEEIVDLPKEFISLANKNLPPQASSALRYLKSRNVDFSTFRAIALNNVICSGIYQVYRVSAFRKICTT